LKHLDALTASLALRLRAVVVIDLAVDQAPTAATAAAPLPGADLAVTHDWLAVLEGDERHGVLVAVPQVEMLYHSKHGPVVLCPSN